MNHEQASRKVRLRRREFLARAAATGGAAAWGLVASGQLSGKAKEGKGTAHGPVKSFCVDFNWGEKDVAEPGMFAQAEPKEHVHWYQDLGVNTIQTFCVTTNGYAWYPSEVAPITPGLKHPNFLGDMVELGHKANLKVFGYYTLGANTYWERRNPATVHGDDSDYIKIPFTLEYLDYFCRMVQDTLKKVAVDGFMVDWVRPTQHKNWLACERQMYQELLGEKFPDSAPPSKEAALEFDRRAMERAWNRIKETVEATRRVKIWTNHPFVNEEREIWQGHRLLKEVDWLLNESPDASWLEWLRGEVGPHTLIIQNLCGWGNHDANLWRKIDTKVFGLYGFAKADPATTLPTEKVPVNIKNIQIIREAYHSV